MIFSPIDSILVEMLKGVLNLTIIFFIWYSCNKPIFLDWQFFFFQKMTFFPIPSWKQKMCFKAHLCSFPLDSFLINFHSVRLQVRSHYDSSTLHCRLKNRTVCRLSEDTECGRHIDEQWWDKELNLSWPIRRNHKLKLWTLSWSHQKHN